MTNQDEKYIFFKNMLSSFLIQFKLLPQPKHQPQPPKKPPQPLHQLSVQITYQMLERFAHRSNAFLKQIQVSSTLNLLPTE